MDSQSDNTEQLALEFLAAEYERDGKAGSAEHIRTQPLLPNKARAVRAIAAALRQQPAPVDLEQFREAVKCWRRSAAACGSSDDVKEADRLLSIIDSAGKVASAEPVAWITPESIRHLAKMNGPANVVVWNCASANARVPLYAAPQKPAPVVFRNDGSSEADFIAHHADACTACGGSGHKSDQQPAPVVDDGGVARSMKLAAAEEQAEAWQAVCSLLSELRPGWAVGRVAGITLALNAIRSLSAPAVDDAMVERALNAKVRNWPVRQLFDSECEARIAMRAALTAALAREQPVPVTASA